MNAKQWICVVLILLLTLAQVYFMMQIVTSIGTLTAAVQNSRVNGTLDIWWNGLYMVICAVLMAAVEVIIRFVASATAASTVTNLRQKNV
jgi:ABC-type multidrug transport system fused ATPase/permease subunit